MGRVATAAILVVVGACSGSPDGTSVSLPDAGPGIGFDDLQYSPTLHRVLVPGGGSGKLDLIDPGTLAVDTVSGFSVVGDYSGGHDDGATAVGEGRGLLFVTDRTSRTLSVVDPSTRAIVSSASLATTPDYVRYVAATDELWVTEPGAAQIEVFALAPQAPFTPTATATIPVANGPESLVIDQSHGRAYTHRWQASTVVVDVRTRQTIAEWPNGCAASRGLAIDEDRQHFVVACSEGTIAVLDAADGGRLLSSIAKGSGFDVIGYSTKLHHVYAAGGACGCLVMLGVSAAGELSFLGRSSADGSTHCAVADDVGHAWVCDPDHGKLWRVDDTYAASD
jgi:DNA-binding beta-propeller fold protein YncE